MALIWTDRSGSLPLLRSFNDTLGTSLFLPPSMMPSSNQPVTTSIGSSEATASVDAPQPAVKSTSRTTSDRPGVRERGGAIRLL